MSEPFRPKFLCTLLSPCPSGPLGLDEKPAYVYQYPSGHHFEGQYGIKVRLYKKGWSRTCDGTRLLGHFVTWQDAVLNMPALRREIEKKRRSGTRAPTKSRAPRRWGKGVGKGRKREQFDVHDVIRAEAIAEAQRLELERAAASPQVDEDASGAQVAECPICLEELDDASPSLACDHRFHVACLQELAAKAWAEGAARTRAHGTAVLCPCCRGQSHVK